MIPVQQVDSVDTINRFQGGGAPKGVVMVVVMALLYVLPSMLAWKRGTRRKWKVTLINVLLGWTVIGWIVAMVLTFAYEPPSAAEGPDTEHIPGTEPEEG